MGPACRPHNTNRVATNNVHRGAESQVEPSRRERHISSFTGGGGSGSMGMGGRGVVGDRWSQRVLWLCAIGSAVSLYFVAVERQAQNRARAVSEGFKTLDGAGGSGGGEDV